MNKIKSIKDEDKQDKMLDDYLDEHMEEVNEYYDFMKEYAKMLAKVVQCESIVSYNGKKLETIKEKWDIYSNKISYSVWDSYNDVLSKYPFGFKDEIDVFIPSLNKKVTRRVGFQFNDFLHINRQKNVDRCVVEFN